MKSYRPLDIDDNFKETIKFAEFLWHIKVSEYMEKNKTPNGMYGSCVICDGIYINFIPKGKRKPIEMRILGTGSAACGSLPWEDSKDFMLDFLKSRGIECFYNYGRLD